MGASASSMDDVVSSAGRVQEGLAVAAAAAASAAAGFAPARAERTLERRRGGALAAIGQPATHVAAFRRMHIDHESPDEELIKCVVVGDSGVGKTKLVCARACGTSYTLPVLMQIHVPTVWAIDHYATDEEVYDRSLSVIDGVRVSLRLWDTFGYHDKDRRFAYGRASVVLLCFSVVRPGSLRNAQTVWYPEICRCCPGVPVILVGCQADLRYLYSYKSFVELDKGPFFRQINEADLLYPDVGRAAAQALGAVAYYETSVLTGFGVKAVFDNAIRAALLKKAASSIVHNLKSVRRPVPQAPQVPPKPDPPDVSCTPWEDCARLYKDVSKLLLGDSFVDVTFVCQNATYFCHRVVLAASSAWMNDLFGSLAASTDRVTWVDSAWRTELPVPATYAAAFTSASLITHGTCSDNHVLVLSLKDFVNPTCFQSLLRFLYDGYLKDLNDAVSTAHILGMTEIVKLHQDLALRLDPASDRSDAGREVHGMPSRVPAELALDFLRRRSLRMKELLNLNLYTDVSLLMADGELRAHKCVLSARSDFMRALLQSTFKESATQTINFNDISERTGCALLELLYTSDCGDVKPCDLVELLTLTNRLCLPHVLSRVEWMCVRSLRELEAKTEDIIPLVLSIMEVAQLHNAQRLADWCQYYISINYHYCFTHHLRDLKELSPENRAYVARNRWPPLWFLRETGEYLKLVKSAGGGCGEEDGTEDSTAATAEDGYDNEGGDDGGAATAPRAAGCLCFSSKMRSIKESRQRLESGM